MARRRYLTTEAGKDKRLSSVSERAALCYLLSVPHADCCGRLPGDPFEYGCTVIPGRHYSDDDIAAVIAELCECGLYVTYDANGSVVLAFPAKSFVEHQSRALNESSRPEQPEPPDGVQGILRHGYDLGEEARKSGVALPAPRKSAEQRGRTHKSATPPSPSPSPPPSPKKKGRSQRAKPAACPFCEYASSHPGEPIPDGKRFRAQRFHDCAVEMLGPCYPVTPRVRKAWKDAAEEFGEQRALEIWRGFLAERSANGHPIAFFQARFQEYREAQARRDEDIDDTRPG